jgi:hypothetical protein
MEGAVCELNIIINNESKIDYSFLQHFCSVCAKLEIGCVKLAYLLHLALSGKSMRYT